MYRISISLFVSFLTVFVSCGSRDQQKQSPQEIEDPLKHLQGLVERYPDSLMLGQELIQAYRNHGNYDSAIQLTERLIDRDTANAYLWNIMATLFYESGDTLGTIRSLEKAVSMYPLPDYYIALGTVYAEMKNDDALIIADAVIDMPEPNPNRSEAYFIKGLYYNYNGQPRRAIRALDSALALNYTFMYAYREKAIALYELKQYQEALNTLRRAVLLQNRYDEGYYWMGKVYEKLNEPDSAAFSYENALLYDKNYTEAKEALDRLQKNKKR